MAKSKLFGDMLESALKAVGITEDRVSAFIGRPCRCRERKLKLNSLHEWAMSFMKTQREKGEGEAQKKKEELEKMIEG